MYDTYYYFSNYASNGIRTASIGWYIVSFVCFALIFFSMISLSKDGRILVKKVINCFRVHPIWSVLITFFLSYLILWGGIKPPPIVVEEGIKLEEVRQSSNDVFFRWSTKDDRIKSGAVFCIQEYRGNGVWNTMAETTNYQATVSKFMVNEHRSYRIMTDITAKKLSKIEEGIDGN